MTDENSNHHYSTLPNGQLIRVYEGVNMEKPPARPIWPGVVVVCVLALLATFTCLGTLWIARS